MIFCGKVKSVENLALSLKKEFDSSAMGPTAKIRKYHSKLTNSELFQSQSEFKDGLINVMIATSGFGAGVNIPNVLLVIHCDYTFSLRHQLQQGGRGARGIGETAEHCIFYDGETGQHTIEDYICGSSNSRITSWSSIRRDIAAVKLFCLLNQCRRISYQKWLITTRIQKNVAMDSKNVTSV